MTYPNQQQQQQYPTYPPQQQPAAPNQPYQPAPLVYPPAQGGAQAYQQQGYPQVPQAQFQAPPAPQQAPPPPLPRTTAADFLEQPSMSGLSLQFPALGTSHTGIVARPLGDGDFPPQTESDGVTPKRFRDKRIMVRMVVPLKVRPDQRHTDGRATLNVQGQMAEALKQAMSDVGAGHLNGIPEPGAEITVTWTGQIPPRNPMFNPTKVYEVTYKRPAGAAPGPQGNGQAQEQPPWTPQMAEQAGQAAVAGMAQAGSPLAQAMAPQQGGQVADPYYPGGPGTPAGYAQMTQGQPPAPQQPQYAPPQGPPAPQMPAQAPGMAGPAQQVAAATQAAQTAGQAYQQPAPQQAPPGPPPGMHPYTAALMKQATGQQLTAEDQAALAGGPPQ